MRATRILHALTIAAVSLGFAGFASTGARAGTFASYESSLNLQNLDAAPAVISLIFYRKNGTAETIVPDTIPENGQKSYFPLPASVAAGFNGSLVVNSNANLASISNLRAGGAAANGSFIAANSGSTVVGLPILMHNNGPALNNTWFNVQNTGSVDADVSVIYSDGTTAGFNGLKPGAARTFDQKTESHAQPAFAGTVHGTQPVAVTVIQETARVLLVSNGFAANSPALRPVMPLVNIQPGRGLQTGVNLQNMGGTPTEVTLTYSRGSGGTCSETQAVDPGALKVFALQSFAGNPGDPNPDGVRSDCPKGQAFVGSARVTANSANMPLAAVVNQLKYTASSSAYNSSNPAAATAKFVAPLVMDRNGPWDLFTSINMMNAGMVATAITCRFTGTGYTYTSPVLQPGQGAVNLHNRAIGDGYVGGATCTANATGARIIAVVNQQGTNPNADQMMSYEAINIP